MGVLETYVIMISIGVLDCVLEDVYYMFYPICLVVTRFGFPCARDERWVINQRKDK